MSEHRYDIRISESCVFMAVLHKVFSSMVTTVLWLTDFKTWRLQVTITLPVARSYMHEVIFVVT